MLLGMKSTNKKFKPKISIRFFSWEGFTNPYNSGYLPELGTFQIPLIHESSCMSKHSNRTTCHTLFLPLTKLSTISGMTFLGLGMFSMCNVRSELHNTGKKTDKLETLMIRIGMFSG